MGMLYVLFKKVRIPYDIARFATKTGENYRNSNSFFFTFLKFPMAQN